jgi:hypothetical protein
MFEISRTGGKSMKERIRELEDQASQYASRETTDLDEWEFIFRKKFAELIVRECLKIVEPTEDSGDEWCVTLKGTAQEIREHFGVEE